MSTDLARVDQRPQSAPVAKGIAQSLAGSEERYLAALDRRPFEYAKFPEFTEIYDGARSNHRGEVSWSGWKRVKEYEPRLPKLADIEAWVAEIEAAMNALPDKRAATAMIAMLVACFPNGRPPTLAAYSDTLVYEAMALGHTPNEVALACRELRRTVSFLPSVAEWVAALASAKKAWAAAYSTSTFILQRLERIVEVAALPEPERTEPWERNVRRTAEEAQERPTEEIPF